MNLTQLFNFVGVALKSIQGFIQFLKNDDNDESTSDEN